VQIKMGNTDVVGAVASLRSEVSRNSSIPDRAKIFVSPRKRRDLLWGPPTLLFSGLRESTAVE
jgi:hypothetical protein